MAWLDPLLGQTVGLDTAPLIYYIEEKAGFIDKVAPFFEAIAAGELQAVTSTLTLLEVLVVPLREGRHDLTRRYIEIMAGDAGIRFVEVDLAIAETAARIRAEYGTAPPDAIHLATAVISGARYFLTNDKHIPNLPNLELLLVDDLAPV